MASPLEDVYCTLLMSDSYLPGAAVLAHSLRDAGTKKKLAVLVTLDTLSADTVEKLRTLYDFLIPVQHIRNPIPANLYLMGRPDLAFSFTKIALWRQTQFRKIVYLDADMVALRALDELFDLDADFAAAPDIGWPDAFNSGLMVVTPNMGDYWALETMAAAGDSFDGADQGLLNQYYQHRNWHRLSFTYNCTPNSEYQWEPAYRYYKSNISAVHFIGKDKPWMDGKKAPGGPGVYSELVARWWAVHDKHLKETKREPQPYLYSGVSPAGQAPIPDIVIEPEAPPEAPLTTTELPFSEPGEPAENLLLGIVEPTPTVEQRRFSAPQMEWDATISAPPPESRPEAANFPQEIYEFNESRELFHAPKSYPEPPKDMWYKVPDTKPTLSETPKPIFPWEQIPDRPKPTRIFSVDTSPLPTPEAMSNPTAPAPAPAPGPASGPTHALAEAPAQAPAPTHPFSTVHYEGAETTSKPGEGAETTASASPEPASTPKMADAFHQSGVNAWDSVPGIEHYVRAIMNSHSRRAKPQVLYSSGSPEELVSDGSGKGRRESVLITDFPSEVERPSLPVTPAPRPTVWRKDKDAAFELPEAEGVPDQAEWVRFECPQCGFQSARIEDFYRPGHDYPNIPTVAPVHDTSSLLPQSPAKLEAPGGTESSRATASEKLSVPPERKYRSGTSARGAPLASLTDPSLLAPSPSSDPSVPSSSASIVASTL
ncbi:nucleotide-diphospho-sugar transferase [Westerdykella ornata]|uniref:glycogenin glucosyltransferase n=1 Tax=Westerdykella ornata TaxID=318751 RepID=A0A6A6JFQ6_WESOR|nr:nucleotide-diphospho-sugar transferase [Westerdykella ornata]KAF2275105.1 nucleotide-diphospho-sugar transferase [Westerdykella ornata]